jgi:hypothetical protein
VHSVVGFAEQVLGDGIQPHCQLLERRRHQGVPADAAPGKSCCEAVHIWLLYMYSSVAKEVVVTTAAEFEITTGSDQ